MPRRAFWVYNLNAERMRRRSFLAGKTAHWAGKAGAMTGRVERLAQAVQVDSYPVCIEKLRIACQIYGQTDGEPMILRRAKTLAAILERITISIEEDELIVGQGASQPMGLEIDPEYGIWTQDEIDAL